VHDVLGDFGHLGRIRMCANSCAGCSLDCFSATSRDGPCGALHYDSSVAAVARHLNLPSIHEFGTSSVSFRLV
jgi:hypothetical protein